MGSTSRSTLEDSADGRRGSFALEESSKSDAETNNRRAHLEVYRDAEPWEYWWKMLQRVGFLAAVVLSIVVMHANNEGWFKVDRSDPLTRVRVGWQYACVNETTGPGREPCAAHNTFNTIADSISESAHRLAIGIVVALAASWVFPFMAFALVSQLQSSLKRVRNCWHGCTIGFGWLASGAALLALSMSFWALVEREVKSKTLSALDVTCDNSVVCESVFGVEQCPGVSCRSGDGLIACDGFVECTTSRVELTCASPLAVCELDPGYAFWCTVCAAGVWLLVGVSTMLGSAIIGRKL